MCGRYSFTSPLEALRGLFGLEGVLPHLRPRYNIAPSQPIVVLRRNSPVVDAAVVRWGLIPFWSKVPPSPPPINARSESVAEKPTFREAFRKRRCLVPANGSFEWRTTGGTKQPFYFSRPDGAPFVMAGIWERWTPPEGPPIETGAILTTAANGVVAPIHDRMPVILTLDDAMAWLDPEADAEGLKALLRPAPDNLLTSWPVGLDVNRPVHDHPGIIAPIVEGPPVQPRLL